VSAKMNGQQVRPERDISNLANFYDLNVSDGNNVLIQDLQTRFKSPVYRNAESIVVKYTDASTGEIIETPLKEFREKLPRSINPYIQRDKVKVLGLAPDDTASKRGTEYIELGIEQQPLLEKFTDIIDQNLGGN
jgi:hypothetical protein